MQGGSFVGNFFKIAAGPAGWFWLAAEKSGRKKHIQELEEQKEIDKKLDEMFPKDVNLHSTSEADNFWGPMDEYEMEEEENPRLSRPQLKPFDKPSFQVLPYSKQTYADPYQRQFSQSQTLSFPVAESKYKTQLRPLTTQQYSYDDDDEMY